jgi:hypothetical protein
MKRREFLKAGTAAGILAAGAGGPVFGAADSSCYLPGDIVDGEVFFLDAQRKPVRLLDALKPGVKVMVLAIIGGAYLTATDKHGGIWCEDTLDEFGNIKAAANAFKDKGVQFVGVACPPVYSDRYGWEKGVFLDEPESSEKFSQAARQFIEKTEALKKDRTIPLETLFYDLRYRLLWNKREYSAKPGYGTVYPWQGKFKWQKDEQRYGTPCFWFLDPKGKILREPLYGNNYSSVPPRILFTYWELESALGESLAK